MSKLMLKDYAAAKSLPEEFLRSCGLADSWSGIKIPYYQADGSCALVKTRHTLSREKEKPQFSYSQSTGLIPLGLNRLSYSLDTVFLLEGETDYFTFIYTKHNCLGIPGSTNFKEKFVEFIKDFKRIVIVVHNDKAGKDFEVSIRKSLSSVVAERDVIAISFAEFGNDANDCWLELKDIETFQKTVQLKVDSALSTLPKEIQFDDDLITIGQNSITLTKIKHSEKGTHESDPMPVADFVVQIIGQKVVFDHDGSVKNRVLIAKATGKNWTNEFELTNEQLSSISKFQEAIERQLGTKAKTYRRNSYYIVKAVAMVLGATKEAVYVDTPGFQKDCYIHGSFKIDETGIHKSSERLVSKTDIPSLDKLDFISMARDEAKSLQRDYIENLENAYTPEAAACGIVVPALTLLRNSHLPGIRDVQIFPELLADQGKGKTELSLNIAAFYTTAPEEADFNKPSDSFASIEEMIHKYNSAGFKYNDFKGTAGTQNVREMAERVQNWVNGVSYMKFRDKMVKASIPFHGLPWINGQDRLSYYLSSLASRAVTFGVSNTGAKANFNVLVDLRKNLCGITPHLIFEFFFSKEGQAFLRSRFNHYLDEYSKILKAEFAVDRMIKTAALTNIALELMWKFAYGDEAKERLEMHKETLRQVHLRQVIYVREADLIHQLISSLIAGLKSGVIFLGKDRPSHCNAGAVSVGQLPNFNDNKVWVNPQPLLAFIKGSKGTQEIASTSQSMITRELKNRGLLISSKSRATTRIEQNGDLGWLLKFSTLTELEKCLKELSGLYIPTDDDGE